MVPYGRASPVVSWCIASRRMLATRACSSTKRIQQGKARVGPLELEVPPGHGIPATVLKVLAAGPLVRLELRRRDTGEPLEVELSRDRYQELQLQQGDQVYASPRNLRVFVEPGSAAPPPPPPPERAGRP